jgi:hypothetical protein
LLCIVFAKYDFKRFPSSLKGNGEIIVSLEMLSRRYNCLESHIVEIRQGGKIFFKFLTCFEQPKEILKMVKRRSKSDYFFLGNRRQKFENFCDVCDF